MLAKGFVIKAAVPEKERSGEDSGVHSSTALRPDLKQADFSMSPLHLSSSGHRPPGSSAENNGAAKAAWRVLESRAVPAVPHQVPDLQELLPCSQHLSSSAWGNTARFTMKLFLHSPPSVEESNRVMHTGCWSLCCFSELPGGRQD